MATFNSEAGFAGAHPRIVPGRDGALRRPRRVQRHNYGHNHFAGTEDHSARSARAGTSQRAIPAAPKALCGYAGFAAKGMLILGVCVVAYGLARASGVAATNVFAVRAEAAFHRTQKQFQARTNDVVAAWKFARACFDLADFTPNDAKHAAIARQGIAACRLAIVLEPDSAAAHYYLGENLGQLARTETFGALKLVRRIEREFKTASKLDAHFDYAGPERSLGLLYRDAPGWPISIGSRRKALKWFKAAERLEPAYPENHLNLIESYLAWHDRAAAMHELHELDALWPAARTNLVGPHWERDWADWSARRNKARERLGETSARTESSKKGL